VHNNSLETCYYFLNNKNLLLARAFSFSIRTYRYWNHEHTKKIQRQQIVDSPTFYSVGHRGDHNRRSTLSFHVRWSRFNNSSDSWEQTVQGPVATENLIQDFPGLFPDLYLLVPWAHSPTHSHVHTFSDCLTTPDSDFPHLTFMYSTHSTLCCCIIPCS
jgi:hypothetical protein